MPTSPSTPRVVPDTAELQALRVLSRDVATAVAQHRAGRLTDAAMDTLGETLDAVRNELRVNHSPAAELEARRLLAAYRPATPSAGVIA